MNKIFKENKAFFIMFPLVVLVDQITKAIAKATLANRYITIIKNFFGFTLVYNEGAAWGSLSGQRIILVLISLISCIAIAVYYLKSKPQKISKFALVMIFSGAFGNMIDRIATGKVIDFIDINIFVIFGGNFPIFNIADLFVTFGALTFLVASFIEKDGK